MGRRVPDTAKILGSTLKRMRKSAGLSMKDVAQALGVSYQQIQKYECGSNRFPIENLYILKRFYGVEYQDFFQGFDADPNVCEIQKLYPDFKSFISKLSDRELRERAYYIAEVIRDQLTS